MKTLSKFTSHINSVFQNAQFGHFLSHTRARNWNQVRKKWRKVNSQKIYTCCLRKWHDETLQQPSWSAPVAPTTVTMSLLHAICCIQVFPPPAHHLLSLWGLWDSTQQFSTGWCSSSVMKMSCEHESQWIGKKCLHSDSSCRTGLTSYLLLWMSKLLSWLDTQQP